MGLPGSGKTTLSDKITASLLEKSYSVVRLNADEQRQKYHDWDFTLEGRLRQAQRMFNFCEWKDGYSKKRTEDIAVVDFVAPNQKSRSIFSPDYLIWMDTINECRFDDTQQLFLDPLCYDYRVQDSDNEKHVQNIINDVLNPQNGF